MMQTLFLLLRFLSGDLIYQAAGTLITLACLALALPFRSAPRWWKVGGLTAVLLLFLTWQIAAHWGIEMWQSLMDKPLGPPLQLYDTLNL